MVLIKVRLEPMVERCYICPDSTKNLPVVTTEISREAYLEMRMRIKTLGEAMERKVGEVNDETKYYLFSGSNVFLRHGLVQEGIAVTTDNEKGFPMIRFFANSLEDMKDLERTCGLYGGGA